MAWDPKKHKVIASKEVTVDDSTIIIEIYSYNGGDPKLSFKTKIVKKDKSEMILPLKGGMDLKLGRRVCKEAIRMLKELEE